METTKPARLRRHSHAALPAYACEYRYYTIGAKVWNTGEVWRVTVCYLDIAEETVVGLAFCASSDNFSREHGRLIAQGRARQYLAGARHPERWNLFRLPLTDLLDTVGWSMERLGGTEMAPYGRKAFLARYQFRLPSPKPLPLNPVFQKTFLTGMVGRTEDVRFVSISADSRKRPTEY